MIKDKIIIMPLESSWDHSADFLRQTALTLSKNNLVYIYDQNNHYFFLKKNKKCSYPRYQNIIFHQVKYFLPFERFTFVDKINRYLSFRIFSKNIQKKQKFLWIFYPNYWNLTKIANKSMIKIYDCVDYSEDQEKEKLLIKQVDYFFVNSMALQKLHENKSKKPIYIDSQGFFQPDEKKIKSINIKKNHKKIIVGYVGGINYRLDFPLLDKLIKNNPQWQFVFYGPEQKNQKEDKLFKTQAWVRKIKSYKNVSFGKSNNRYKVYGIIKSFDIAIIPYNKNITFNKYCYPMKVFEYLYFAKPIISSEIEELKAEKFNKFIKIAKKYNDWEKAISCFSKKKYDTNTRGKSKILAKNNSWKKKLNTIERHLLLD